MTAVAPRQAYPAQSHPSHTAAHSHSHRHHPYAAPSHSSAASSSSHATRKYPTKPSKSSDDESCLHPKSAYANGTLPSPPRSRRASSQTPPVGLGVAFGGAAGGKWWDEELPAPPASLSSILDSFRRSGEGDRELLLSILGAKKAEEERLTALIQTRLTVLQARLALVAPATPAPAPFNPNNLMPSPMPSSHDLPSPRSSVPAELRRSPPAAPSLRLPIIPSSSSRLSPHRDSSVLTGRTRTPSLMSRGSAASDSSSAGALSPTAEGDRSFPSLRIPSPSRDARDVDMESPRFASGPAQSFWRKDLSGSTPTLPPIRIEREASEGKHRDSRSTSPRSASGRQVNGLDMLLDAGRRAEL